VQTCYAKWLNIVVHIVDLMLHSLCVYSGTVIIFFFFICRILAYFCVVCYVLSYYMLNKDEYNNNDNMIKHTRTTSTTMNCIDYFSA